MKRLSRPLQVLLWSPAIIGVLSLLGWAAHIKRLTSFGPSFIPMAPSAAILFSVAGLALPLLFSFPKSSFTKSYLSFASILTFFSTAWITATFFHWHGPQLESFLISETENFGKVKLGRMSPLTSFGFFVSSIVLLFFLKEKKKVWLGNTAGALASFGFCFTLTILIGYVYGTPILYGGRVIPMALPSAIAFLCLFLGFATLLGPAYFPFRPLTGPSARAQLLRAFLPASFLAVLSHGLVFKVLSSLVHINSALLLALSAFAFALVATLFTLHISRTLGTKIDEAEKAMMEFSKLKTEFLSNVSHELRTPLNAIIGMSDTVSQQPLTSNQQMCIESIQDSGVYLLRLVDDILSFSKITSEGNVPNEKAPFQLGTCIQKITNGLEPFTRKKTVTLKTEIAPDVPVTLYGNEQNLSQVLFHLIENAVKFSSQTEVLITARKEHQKKKGDFLRFEITDSGPGIPTAIQKGMFHIFFHTDGSSHRKYGGLGIGLALCKTIVTAMGGTIGYESLKRGGTKFWFSIKLETHAPALSVAPEVLTDFTLKPKSLSRINFAQKSA